MTTEYSRQPNNHQIGRAGLYRAASELQIRGVDVHVEREPGGAIDVLTLRRKGNFVVKMRVRTSLRSSSRGYQVRLDDDFTAVDVWVFLVLKTTGEATFYIVPPKWLATDVEHAHRQYLADHGDERPRTKDSQHHHIDIERLGQWRDAWGVIEELN
jgi:hypothetical protein